MSAREDLSVLIRNVSVGMEATDTLIDQVADGLCVEALRDFLSRLESSAGYGVVENFLAHNPDLEQLTEVSTPK